ncbi:hypothetical protein [Methanobacterium alcaliphilum]|uniref:hypothetical protein n=1 Tax=Methanobacterium alcaliphilum TaxID=392018 RepID=UPI00200A6D14|nr:hypothetical protein [Methanobacterium alcaliphilum]MCK9150475.1 hypothetical protein [Methanobacterium alcaliphilum]
MNISKIGLICILTILCLVVGISGCTSDTTDNSQTSNSNSDINSDIDSNNESQASTFNPVSFKGSGEKATESFNWPGGLMRISMKHDGESNFIIHLVNADDGSTQEYVENEIGSVDNSRAFSIPAGEYLLDVQADGSWKITISQ